MDSYIRVLNHLAYVLESLILDYTGEAKGEARYLADLLESDPLYAIENREAIAAEIRKAADQYVCERDRDPRLGASIFSRVSRKTWEAYMDLLSKDGEAPSAEDEA
jgi:hypothetical protein